MCLSSPMRTSKLQLAAEQPSTEECLIPPKNDTPHPRAKEKTQHDGRKGEIAFRLKLQGFLQSLRGWLSS